MSDERIDCPICHRTDHIGNIVSCECGAIYIELPASEEPAEKEK